MRARLLLWTLAATTAAGIAVGATGRRDPIPAGEWPAYGRDPGGARYSPLTQITRGNVGGLRPAWTYRTGDVSDARTRTASAFEATPIMVEGTLYFPTPFNRVIALDPETGRERWRYDPGLDLARHYAGQLLCRGVSTWPAPGTKSGEPRRRRIFLGTLDARLIALDAATGRPCPDFGTAGTVDLGTGMNDVRRGEYQVTSAPAVIGDLVVVGSSIGDNQRVAETSGAVRAFDARTGRQVWRWDPIPRTPRDPAWRTWKEGSGRTAGAANVWSTISADPERGLLFLPTSSPSPDYYGGERRGENHYANSVVALKAATGERVWHFQVVHHDLWDYDVPAQPALVTVRRGGRDVPAVAVATKIGHLFLLHRETGAPLFPVEERPVPGGGVPGEEPSPTQPFPTAPPALVPQRLRPEDAWGPTPADRERARQRLASLRSEGLFTPPSTQGTIVFPGDLGGMNRSGAAFDPRRGLLITNTNRLARAVTLIPRADAADLRALRATHPGSEFAPQTGTPYAMRREMLLSPDLFPFNSPPWGTLVAVDLARGKVRWETPLGAMPEFAHLPGYERWGSFNLGGAIVTAGGLVFIAAARDNFLRAFDVETGRELWKGELPAGGQATPMTYRARPGGRQYVVIAAGGHSNLRTKMGDSLVAFALPERSRE